MPLLSPADAAYAASHVYNIMNETDVELFGSGLNSKFDIPTSSRFQGTAGAMMFKYSSGFGLAVKGKGPYKDEALIMVRGTVDFLRDLVLTDGNIGLKRSATGNTVHAGFFNVFQSFEDDLTEFFRGYHPKRVHCVGHSLGGALATMVAEWVSHNEVSQPTLYTFGSPRVGFEGFASSLTRQLGEENIFRTYHRTDVVSMVPIWPFLHVPLPGVECFINSPGLVPGISYHKMDSYVNSVSGAESWDSLRQRQPDLGLDKEVENWLSSDSLVTLTTNTIYLVEQALVYIVKKILYLTGIAFQGLIIGGLTVLDRLAMAIEKAVQISKQIGEYVLGLIRKIASALGIVIEETKNITADLIRWILRKFAEAVYRLAKEALRIVHIRI